MSENLLTKGNDFPCKDEERRSSAVTQAVMRSVIVCTSKTGNGTKENPFHTEVSVWSLDGKLIAVFNDWNNAPIR